MKSIAELLIRKEVISNRAITAFVGVASFVIFTALGAYVRIPLNFTPVPLTLQTFFVLLAGAMLGRRLGSLSQGIYLILGMAGLPLFQGGSCSAAYIFGPTGGYLLGFVFAAYVTGLILKDRNSLISIIWAFCVGEVIILSFGAMWLWAGLHISIRQAVYLGVLPFIPGDIIKLLIAAFICKRYIGRAKELFYSLNL